MASDPIEVPQPAQRTITIEQRLAIIARICGEALFSCTGSYEPLNTLEVSSCAQHLKVEIDAIFQDPRMGA